MNYNEILINYIDKHSYGEPVFIEKIKDYFKGIVQDNFEKIFEYANKINDLKPIIKLYEFRCVVMLSKNQA